MSAPRDVGGPPIPDQPRSTIPAEAVERVVDRYDDGAKRRAEYWLGDELVGRRDFHPGGLPECEWSYRSGRQHGWFLRWDVPGIATSAEPYEHGLPHGTAIQWRSDGSVLGTYTLDRGTGLDLWWAPGCEDDDPSGRMHEHLAEVHPMRNGVPHGTEWWLDHDEERVLEERHWFDGQLHGVEREWNLEGRLRRGFPRYWIRGERVDKRRYLRAAAKDPTLPPFRAEENDPRRDFPPEVRAHLRHRRR